MRKWIVTGMGFGLVLFGGLFTLLRPMHCPVNHAASERIEQGMTQEEVHAIMGVPPGDHRTGPFPRRPPVLSLPPHSWVARYEEWEGDEGTVYVDYLAFPGPGETVFAVVFEEAPPSCPGLLELGRWRLARLKERLLP